MELHETVAVPEVVMLLGVIAPQVRFAGTVSVNDTVPVKPLTGETVIVEVAETPALTAAGDVAVIVKSTVPEKVKVAVALWDRVPLVPVIVTVPVDAELHERVAVPELVILLGVIAPQVNPAGTVSVRAIAPVKPFTAVIVIVEVIEVLTVPEGEVAEIVKSVTVKVAVAV